MLNVSISLLEYKIPLFFSVSSNHENTWSSASSPNKELSNTVNSKPFHSPNSANDTSGSITSHLSKSSVNNNSWTESNYSYGSELSSNAQIDCSDQTVFSSKGDSQSDVNKNVITSVNGQESARSSFISNVPHSVSSNSVVRLLKTSFLFYVIYFSWDNNITKLCLIF